MKKNNTKLSMFFSARSDLGMRMRVLKKICEWLGVILAIAFSTWLMFHTFSYDSATHEFRIAFKLWSDFAAHIPLIRSFSMGPNWERLLHMQMIEYPIYPGEPIRYHFLFDMIVGLLEKAGLRIDWALNIPSIIGFASLLMTIFILAKKLFRSTTVALLSVLFFLFNGSLSFLDFFKKHAPIDILTNRDFPAFAPWGPGDITAFWNLNIYTNQRHLAGAFALILFFILTCLRIEHRPVAKQLLWAIVWAVLIGILPYYHQPTLLIMAVLMLIYFLVFPKLRRFLFATGIWSLVFVIPQLLLVKSASNPAEWYPGYIIHNEIYQMNYLEKIGRMIIFWWNNLGAHSVLMLAGFFFIPKQARKIILPIIPIFLIGNLFKFSIEASANHKFFNFVMILGQMISAYTIVLLFQKIKYFPRYLIIGLLILILTLSGIIDFFVVKNDIIGSAKDIPADEAALWITQHTPKNAVFLNSTYMYHPASVAGRSVYLGWPYFAWSAGYVGNRFEMIKTIYGAKSPTLFCELLRQNTIDYFTIQNTSGDSNMAQIDVPYYFATYQPAYANMEKSYGIFATTQICASKK